ncbi:MAG: hypothetical protein QOI50_6936, partial [Pseudonocardiales bacterium]|nr:hypothetical protein [Pseudonocardiales bacterium]
MSATADHHRATPTGSTAEIGGAGSVAGATGGTGSGRPRAEAAVDLGAI